MTPLATGRGHYINASMNSRILRTTCATLSLALALGGCSSSNEEPGVYSGVSGASAGALVRAGSGPSDTMVAGASVGRTAIVTIQIIAKRQASQRQRKVAEERAKAFQARITPEKKAVMKKKKVRYIAVDTVKDERTTAAAKKNVMIWDVESEQIVGNNVYDVESTPSVGQTAKFETYAAEYVGTGS
jgi:hypothetical protein